jgi:hypothetical protein
MLPADELFASNLTAIGLGSIPNFRFNGCGSLNLAQASFLTIGRDLRSIT